MELAGRATAASCSSSPSLHPPCVPCRLGRSPCRCRLAGWPSPWRPSPSIDPKIKTEQNDASITGGFACPVFYEPLIRKGPSGMNLGAKAFFGKEYSEREPTRTELFRSQLDSFLYERGWRQNFNRSGFPGHDEEFQMAQDYFQSVAGGILVDVSCGSGLFSREFASSGAYSSNLALVRADISRLPFASCSIDAIHAGATIHCWPPPLNAVAEISRVQNPGGVFVVSSDNLLSTPTNSGPLSIDPLRSPRQIVGSVNNTYNIFTEGELEDLYRSCGLVNYSSKAQRSFIMFSRQKP